MYFDTDVTRINQFSAWNIVRYSEWNLSDISIRSFFLEMHIIFLIMYIYVFKYQAFCLYMYIEHSTMSKLHSRGKNIPEIKNKGKTIEKRSSGLSLSNKNGENYSK